MTFPHPTAGGRNVSATKDTLRGGFNLTELMVTIAVVSLLALLVVAATSVRQRKTHLATCLDNLQKVNKAITRFTADNGNRLPGQIPGAQGESWWWYKELIKGHMGLPSGPSSPEDRSFACPDDRGYSDPAPFYKTARFDYSSYVFNGVTLPFIPNISGWQLSDVRKPQRTLSVMEWSAHAPISWHASRTARRNQPFYRDALCVVGFVDGHVSFSPIYYDGYNAAYTRDPIPGYAYQYSGN